MTKTLKYSLPALALLAFASTAQAATGFVDNLSGIGDTSIIDAPGASGGFYAGVADAQGKVNDMFAFSLGSSYTSAVVDIFTSPSFATGGTVNLFTDNNGRLGTLLGTLTTTANGSGAPVNFSGYDVLTIAGNFAAGKYDLVVNATGQANQSYSGTVNVSAVPLPAALPMFGAGLVALGALSRRRKAGANSAS